ncbi:MAG: ATPase domain-containing protein [Promethearchaeia archaeon]
MSIDISKFLNKTNQHVDANAIINEQGKDLKQSNISCSGSKHLTEILNGGFYSGKKYLIFGENSTGKTQLCHQLCVEAYKKFSNSIFIDTENTFRPERIKELADTQKLNSTKVLKSILVSKIMSNSMLLLNLKNIKNLIKHKNFKVILIDSINNYYRLEQADSNISYLKAKTTFIKILEYFNNLTNKYKLITIATAQITPNFVNNSIINHTPVGIQYLSHFFSEFLYLSIKEDSTGHAHLVNSFILPEKKALYKITSEGIQDYKL